MTRPLLTVIIPVYNGERFLEDAVHEVHKQGDPNYELIVVDDGSTDGTRELAERFAEAIQYVHQDNRGPAAARNVGLERARGDYVAFLDVDDQWPEGRLESMLHFLFADRSLEVVMGRTHWVLLPGERPVNEPKRNPREWIAPKEPVIAAMLGAAVFRRTVFDRVGMFDPTLRFAEDHDWFIRAKEQGVSLKIVQDVTLFARTHRDNMTRGKSWHDTQILSILRKSLNRRATEGSGTGRSLKKLADYAED